ncbi:hypothetical protein COCON_G00186760 [Conger conger]|uniref:Uncharacterized protein n=1 Tax=Conger conger TaxID=82655 RepID=A0A9Q1D2Z4_CONCO|nr:hypothetical protein COCON_G00186760 [Conger conger]
MCCCVWVVCGTCVCVFSVCLCVRALVCVRELCDNPANSVHPPIRREGAEPDCKAGSHDRQQCLQLCSLVHRLVWVSLCPTALVPVASATWGTQTGDLPMGPKSSYTLTDNLQSVSVQENNRTKPQLFRCLISNWKTITAMSEHNACACLV